MLEKQIKILKSHASTMIAMLLTFAISLFCWWINFERGAIENAAKLTFDRTYKSLEENGYSVTYDDASFNMLYPMNIMTVKNLKIAKKDEFTDFEWFIPKITASANLWSNLTVNISLSHNQKLTIGGVTNILDFKSFKASVKLNQNIKNMETQFTIKDLYLGKAFTAKDVKFASKRVLNKSISDKAPSFKSFLEINNAYVDESTGFPINREIKKIFVQASLIGELMPEKTYKKSVHNWYGDGGFISIDSFDLDWEPLQLKGKGKISLNMGDTFKLFLGTASQGLIEDLYILQKEKILSSKGMFVVNVLLNDKAFMNSKADELLTVTSSFAIDNDKLLIEGIEVYEF